MQTLEKPRISAKIKSLINKIKNPRIKAFFMGPLYPVWIAFSVLVGRATCLEVYFAIFDLLLIAFAFYVCDSMKPIIPILVSFLYRIPLEHSPGVPFHSDYYSAGKFIAPIICFVIAISSLVYLLIRMKVFSKENIKKLPLLVPLLALSLAFLLCGAFSKNKVSGDFWFSVLQVVVLAVVFWLLYLGFKNEDPDELCMYFVYVAAVTAVILILEVLHLYITYDDVLVDGIINKSAINFGWGISNTCGNCLTVLIPLCFLGVCRSKYHYVYFAIASLSLVAAIFTLCRNAVLFGSIFYVICLGICCIFGRKNKMYRYVALGVVAFLVLVGILFGDTIEMLFTTMIAHGLNDNGRYPLWKEAFEGFLEYPIFGNGFHSFVPEVTRNASFIPYLAHNTVFEILYAMGQFGLATYLVYRVYTLEPFVRKITLEKTFLFLSVAVLIVESLIDNYILWFAPTFVYNIAIIVAFKYFEKEKSSSKKN